jgi:hypothetical protein
MAIHLSKMIKMCFVISGFFLGILFLEWVAINAILGCYSLHQMLWVDHDTCFTLKQLIGA